VKNLKHINGFILNEAFLLEGSSLKIEREMIFFLKSCISYMGWAFNPRPDTSTRAIEMPSYKG
jgi:hypothetical protein